MRIKRFKGTLLFEWYIFSKIFEYATSYRFNNLFHYNFQFLAVKIHIYPGYNQNIHIFSFLLNNQNISQVTKLIKFSIHKVKD